MVMLSNCKIVVITSTTLAITSAIVHTGPKVVLTSATTKKKTLTITSVSYEHYNLY